MHVSILAGLPLASSASSERKESVVVRCHQLCRVGVMEALIVAELKARLQPNGGSDFLRAWACALANELVECTHALHTPCHAMPRRGASLRPRLDTFLAFSNHSARDCLSVGATRPYCLTCGDGHTVIAHQDIVVQGVDLETICA